MQCAWQARLLRSHAHMQCMKVRLLCRLARLDASFNSLEGLPEGISGMTSLVGLVLSNNSIGSLLPTISQLQALKTLDLRVNRCAHCYTNTSGHVLHKCLCKEPNGASIRRCRLRLKGSPGVHLQVDIITASWPEHSVSQGNEGFASKLSEPFAWMHWHTGQHQDNLPMRQ